MAEEIKIKIKFQLLISSKQKVPTSENRLPLSDFLIPKVSVPIKTKLHPQPIISEVIPYESTITNHLISRLCSDLVRKELCSIAPPLSFGESPPAAETNMKFHVCMWMHKYIEGITVLKNSTCKKFIPFVDLEMRGERPWRIAGNEQENVSPLIPQI